MKLQQSWINRARVNCAWLTSFAIVLLSLWVSPTAQAQTRTPTPTPPQGITTQEIATQGLILYNTNLRTGAGTAYAVVGKVRAGQTITIMATSADGNWYQVGDGQWLAALVVQRSAETVTPAETPTAARRLVATTAALSATQTVTVTPQLRSLRATATPTATAIISATTPVTATTALRNANLRAGPGTNYAIVGNVRTADRLDLQGRTSDGTWYQLENGSWIAAFLVAPQPPLLPTIAPTVIAGLPTLAPTITPTPVPSTPTTQTAAVPANTAAATAVAPSAPTSSGTTTFVVTQRRLWNPWENGGSTDGPSVHCGQGRNLIVNVLDENGNRLNGVAVQAEYGAKEIWVTGAQGKGAGVVEFVLGSGQDVKVIRDADGSPVNSEAATGLSTDPRGIDQTSLISAGYCQDDDSCRTFMNNVSCIGHYSWTVTFERRR